MNIHYNRVRKPDKTFDYTDPIQEKDTATRIDIDQDGDMDYLYILDGVLFLKKSTLRNTTKVIDTKITIKDIDIKDNPSAPNFFDEDTSFSNMFSFSYRTNRDTDSMWRVEFYDRYMEWDMVKR